MVLGFPLLISLPYSILCCHTYNYQSDAGDVIQAYAGVRERGYPRA
jgi:hypothetical protein